MNGRARRIIPDADMGARNGAAQRLREGAELRIDEAFQRRVFMRRARTRCFPPVCTSAVHCRDLGIENARSRGAHEDACDLM